MEVNQVERAGICKKALYRKNVYRYRPHEFYVFYNGDEPSPAESFMKLSDSYLEKTITPMLELSVRIININLSEGILFWSNVAHLYEYSWLVQQIKEYSAQLSRLWQLRHFIYRQEKTT